MTTDRASRSIEVAVALVMVALGTAGFLAVPRLVSTWAVSIPGMTTSSLSPTFFPRAGMLAVIVTSLCVLLTLRTRPGPLPVAEMKPEDWRRFLIASANIIAYVALIPVFGFVISSGLFILCMVLTAGYRRMWIVFTTAILFPIVTYYLFRWGLKVLLPTGAF